MNRENTKGKKALPWSPTLVLNKSAINSYESSHIIWNLFGIIDLFERPNIKKNIIAIVAMTINCDEFVNEISTPPICISAIFVITNWWIGSIKFGVFSADMVLFFSYFA